MNQNAIDTVKILGWVILVFISLCFTAYTYGYRLNTSQSYPPGVYVISEVKDQYQVQDLILFCPPEGPIILTALERNYINEGPCNAGTVPMIKRIAATAGYDVLLDEVIFINGLPLSDTIIQTQDRQLRPLTAFSHHGRHAFMLPPETVFVYSEYAPTHSFDSRYFGYVSMDNIHGIVKPVLLWSDIITSWEVVRLSAMY